MNDDLHPDPTDTELLASALIDGALPADEAGSAQASPEVAALAEQFTAVRTVLADVPPAPIEARERALAAALAVFEELHSATPAAAAAAPAGLAPVVRLADRRRWPSRVLAAAAAVMVLGIVGVSVFRSPGGNDSASQGTELARGEMAADQVATATIGAINAPASPAIAVHSPEELAALAEAKLAPTPLASSPDTTTAADGEVAGASVGGGSLALGCLDDTQVFVADILYNGRTAIAARDTVTGVTQAIDEQCNVLAEAAP